MRFLLPSLRLKTEHERIGIAKKHSLLCSILFCLCTGLGSKAAVESRSLEWMLVLLKHYLNYVGLLSNPRLVTQRYDGDVFTSLEVDL
jgi:hypothetical protein